MSTTTLLSAATTAAAGSKKTLVGAFNTFQAVGTVSSGTGAATINIEVSNDETNWIVAGTITLTLSTTAATDGFTISAAWPFCRANVTAISGTGASVTVTAGR